MSRSFALTLTIAGFLIPALWSQDTQSNPSSLRPGQMFPQFSGQTLTGKSVELPAAALGGPAIVIFSFSRTAGKDARSWNEHLSRDFPQAVPSYTVIVLESVPKLVRGMALSGIKGSMPPPMQDRTIVLYRDEALWKQRLAFSDDSRAYLILLGPDGRMLWSSDGQFTDSDYARLKDRIEKLLLPHS